MCKILARTKDMAREEWLQLRKQGIGGSDAGAVCGLNPYTSAMDVFLEKTRKELPEEKDNEAMREGRDLEDYVAKRFCEETGYRVRRSHVTYVSEQYPFMLADVDRLLVGKEQGLVGLECKTASPYSAEKWKDGKIPAHYLAQCYHYMAVLNAKAWYIAVLIYGKEFKYIRIDRNEEIIQNLIKIEECFWNGHVLSGTMPEPDGSHAADTFLNGQYRNSIPESRIFLDGFDEKLKRREEITALMEELDTEKKKIEQEVKLYMKEAELAENEHFLVSWKSSISNRLDSKKLKEELPEVYQKYLKETGSRKFVIKTVA